MKNNTSTIVLLALVAFFLCNFNVTAQDNNRTYVQIRVDGLSCPFCAYGLEKKLKKVDGVANVLIEFEDGVVNLDVPRDKKPTKESLKKVVTDAGFTPRKIKFSDTPFIKEGDDN